MKKVFLDGGGNQGQGLRQIYKKYNMNDEWIIETFEPNKSCEIEKHLEDIKVKINNKAIYDYTGFVDFSIMIEDSQGSAISNTMIEGLCSDPSSLSFRKNDCIIKVECLDLSDIIRKYEDADFLVVKLDIEGAEFRVLRKIIENGTIRKINDLYVEWHHPYVKGENLETVNFLKQEIKKNNVNVYDWH